MSKERFYVHLEDGASNNEPLIRRFFEEYKGKTFGEVIEYMLNPAGDSLNEAYSPMEMRSAQGLQRTYNARGQNEGLGSSTIVLTASQLNDVEDKTLSFNDKVNSCLTDILKTETITSEGKEELRENIYLTLTKVNGGGI